MKEQILNSLKDMGFMLEEIKDFGFLFQYEGSNLVYAPNSKDEDFLNICAPGVMDIKEDQTSINIYELANQLNAELNYIKAYVMEGRLWIGYEMKRDIAKDDFKEVIGNMIVYLDAAVNYAKDIIENGDSQVQDNEASLDEETFEDISTEDTPKENNSLISNFCNLWKRIKSK